MPSNDGGDAALPYETAVGAGLVLCALSGRRLAWDGRRRVLVVGDPSVGVAGAVIGIRADPIVLDSLWTAVHEVPGPRGVRDDVLGTD